VQHAGGFGHHQDGGGIIGVQLFQQLLHRCFRGFERTPGDPVSGAVKDVVTRA